MGRLGANTDYEDLRRARILENQARLDSLGVQKTVSELKSIITSSTKSQRTHVRKCSKVDYSSTPLRRSSRLQGISCDSEPTSERLRAKTDYEDLRKARILENQARLATLGVLKAVSELKSITSSAKSQRTHVRKCSKVDSSTPLRRSSRLQGISCDSEQSKERLGYLHCSGRLQQKSCNSEPTCIGGLYKDSDDKDEEEKRPANAPLVSVKKGLAPRFSSEALARRCTSKGRGSLYDPIYGICCHFCRQKKLCGEQDCKRCGNLDVDQPCIGKTDCSICHSSNGVLCRGCLKVRYGEELQEVRANKKWMCPHCIEEKGIRPYWICNSSLCLTKRKMVPTGIAIFKAREKGYKSVAHLLMDELQRADKRKRWDSLLS